jgi:hypothetical protein
MNARITFRVDPDPSISDDTEAFSLASQRDWAYETERWKLQDGQFWVANFTGFCFDQETNLGVLTLSEALDQVHFSVPEDG